MIRHWENIELNIKFYFPVMSSLFGEHSVHVGIDYLGMRKVSIHLTLGNEPCLSLIYLISGEHRPQLHQGLNVESVRLCYHGAVKLSRSVRTLEMKC